MIRIGYARDIHRLEKNGRPFILGGINIPFDKGNVSHSDGDCLYHAIAESLMGALALGDLGKLFPDNDDKYLDYDSSLIVKEVVSLMKKEGYHVINIDTSIVLERPKLKDYIDEMRKNIASLLEISISCVSVKAQTNEKVGEVGQGNAIECFSSVLLEKE
jgi:2-C-methyl-D-erythritol 2,4-cyclodiphosphate synthase